MSITDNTTGATDVARDHAQEAAQQAMSRAGDVAGHAGDAARDVKDTALDQAQQVKEQTVRQARNLVSGTTAQLNEQASAQAQRLSGNLKELGDELRQMAGAGTDGGTATELVHQASERAHQLAGYLDGRDATTILDDVRGYASRRPGAFLAGAALLGIVAGRVGRGVKDAGGSDDASVGAPATTPSVVVLPEDPSTTAASTYDDGFSSSTYRYTEQDPTTGALMRDTSEEPS